MLELRAVTPALAVTDLRKTLRAHRSAARRRARGRRGRAVRPARAQRRRQVDAGEDRLRARAADRRGARSIAGAPAGSLEAQRALGYLAELFRFPEWQTADELLALHQRLAESAGGAAERAELLDARRARGGGAAAGRRRCPRACSSGSGSRRRWSARRGCCCSTSPRARSTPPAAARCAGCSRSCARAAWRCCSTRTCSPRSSSSATAWRSSPAARSSPPARPPSCPSRAAWRSRPPPARACSPRPSRDDAPRIVRELVAAGEEVYGVRVLTSSLEDAYLEAVGEDAR